MSMFEEAEGKKAVKTPADEAKILMKKHKVDTVYRCGVYWFFNRVSAENYGREINAKVEEYKAE